MEKLNLYLNDSQYEKLCILAKEIDKIMANPTVNWEE